MGEINVHVEPPPDPFNLFQNTVPKMDGDYEVGQTLTKAGDYVEFKTKMNVIVVVTACSVDLPLRESNQSVVHQLPLGLKSTDFWQLAPVATGESASFSLYLASSFRSRGPANSLVPSLRVTERAAAVGVLFRA